MKFNLQINISQAENGFVVNINSSGANKQFISSSLPEAVKIVSEFIAAIQLPKNP